ncbi:DUF898 family protein [Providencia stuartii]|nr:DUF898 family protein [Providencia stuartii]
MAYVILSLFFLMLPYFIIRSCRFHAIMTSYRNVRFNFLGSYKKRVLVLFYPSIITFIRCNCFFILGRTSHRFNRYL